MSATPTPYLDVNSVLKVVMTPEKKMDQLKETIEFIRCNLILNSPTSTQ